MRLHDESSGGVNSYSRLIIERRARWVLFRNQQRQETEQARMQKKSLKECRLEKLQKIQCEGEAMEAFRQSEAV